MSNIYRAFEAPQRLGPEANNNPIERTTCLAPRFNEPADRPPTLVLALEPKPVLILCNPRPT